MEEMERIRSDISQLTRRVDDFSLRLAVVEAEREGFNDKLDALKELLTEKMGGMQRSIEGWNKLGFWLLTFVGGGFAAAFVAFVVRGGLAP